MTPEGKVKKECRAYLRRIGCYVFSPVQMGYGASTIDDLVCYRGHFVGIEYKAPGINVPTDRQDAVMNQIIAAGGTAILINNFPALVDVMCSVVSKVPVRV